MEQRRCESAIRTDMAIELRELDASADGVEESEERLGDVVVTRIKLLTDEAAGRYGKNKGSYITLDAEGIAARPLDLFDEVAARVAEEIQRLAGMELSRAVVLVVGLGNREVTPDSLGPRVVERIYVTRHIRQLLPDALDADVSSVCAIAPGVLGVTGIETVELVRGAVEHVRPDLVIAIDALAARRATRIGASVQLTDAGISPGSGVGNRRASISEQELNCKVLAIGVPLVVYAATVVRDALGLMAKDAGMPDGDLEGVSIAEEMGDMIMTPKDIDTMVDDMAGILARGINAAIFAEEYEAVRQLTT
ncbi:MAG: GPR endopeptidase [Clostridia bacterium]|nr:GPR endopeptidase [Clostridia bacterium]